MAGAKWFSFVKPISAKIMEQSRDAVNRTAAKVVETAVRLAPHDTGKLKKTIRAELSTGPIGFERRLEATVLAGGQGVVDYAVPVEFGTVHQRAQPYLQPAVESQRIPHMNRLRLAVGLTGTGSGVASFGVPLFESKGI